MAHPSLVLKAGLLDRLQRMSGLMTDRALAGALGVAEVDLASARNGAPVDAQMLAGLSDAFGLSLGEVATITTVDQDQAVAS